MPYKSKKQQRKFHVMEEQGKISHATVAEYDNATKGRYQSLPEKVKPKRKGKK